MMLQRMLLLCLPLGISCVPAADDAFDVVTAELRVVDPESRMHALRDVGVHAGRIVPGG